MRGAAAYCRGSASAGCSDSRYVHLMDEGLGDADFLDAVVAQEPVGA